ncbi:MAG: NAD(P)-dependent alcohol dehydrogenase [Clostridia bacterium]|nr:NAD(P)-dependent alcohol dehydrogenase [Deltaproteobacteria bacterium]
MIAAKSYAVDSHTAKFAPHAINRRALRPNDVHIAISHCGICHSDLHTARGEWQGTTYPCVPGHEIVGKVVAVGPAVKNFKKDDYVGVGCMVDSCQDCQSCKDGLEQFCEKGFTGTYNGKDRQSGENTLGGYSDQIIVSDKFVLRVPKNLDPSKAAPLLCAGITLWSPLKHWGAGKGKKVGINGLGGLGHMGVKLAHALGAKVVLFSRTESKREDALRLGADDVIISTNNEQMAKHASSFDLIIDTVSAPHDLNAGIGMLKRDGSYVMVGASAENHPPMAHFPFIMGRRSFAGSLIGGIKETQEMLDFCGEHNISSETEVLPIQKIEEAYERMEKSDVRYRFVIDMQSIR